MVLFQDKLPVRSILVVCLLLTSVWLGVLGFIFESGEGLDHNGESITLNTTWYATDNPHNITGTVYVLGAKLTIEPGVIIKNNATGGSGSITVDNGGTLSVEGTNVGPIQFTSNESTPLVGDWTGILFGSFASGGILRNCNISYPSEGVDIQNGNVLIADSSISYTTTGIWIKGGTVEIYNTNISNSDKGIHVNGGTSTIDNITLYNCTRSLWLESSVNITNSTVTNSIDENFYLSNGVVINTINCTYDSNNKVTGGSTLVKQWYVHLCVTDNFGNPLKDVNITVTPNGQEPVYYKTDATGWKRWIVCTEFERTTSSTIYRTPYNITVTKPGYNSTMIQSSLNRSSTFQLKIKDTIYPTSEIDTVPQYWYNTSGAELKYSATDNSYLKNVSLFYRYSDDNQTFSSSKKINSTTIPGDQNSTAGAFMFKFNDGEGYYKTYTIATDKSGNPESTPSAVIQNLGQDVSEPSITDIEVTNITEDSDIDCRVKVTLQDTLSGLTEIPKFSFKYDSSSSTWSLANMDMTELSRCLPLTRSRTGEVEYYFDILAPNQGWEHYQGKSLLWKVSCSDVAGNVKTISSSEIIDFINHAPAIQINMPVQNQWYNGIIEIQTTPNDDLDINDPVGEWGVDYVIVQYSIDSTINGYNGTWHDIARSPITTKPFNVNWDSLGVIGTNMNTWLRVRSIDNGGLTSIWEKLQIKIDNEPSTSEIKDYKDIWHNSDFQINITATDGVGSGLGVIYFIQNNGSINSTQNGMPIVTKESDNNIIEYWSSDKLGNKEIHKFLTGIKLDKTKPKLTEIKITNITATTLSTTEVVLQLNSSDELSGLKNPPQYRIQFPTENFSEWGSMELFLGNRYQIILNQSRINWSDFGGSKLIFEFKSTDNAGNTITTRSTEFIDPLAIPVVNIVHTPVTEQYVNNTITINATVIAGSAPDEMLIYYKPVDGISFDPLKMTLTGQIVNTADRNKNMYKYSIDLLVQAKPGMMYYYFSANYNTFTVTLPTVQPALNAFQVKINKEPTDIDKVELPNWWIEQYFGDITEYIENDDPDGDGLTNLQEYMNGTNPTNNDTDGDALPDKWELDHQLDPTDPAGKNGPNGDADGDGISNLDEYKKEIKPDGDSQQSSPGDSKTGEQTIVYIIIIIILIVIIALLSFATFRRRKSYTYRKPRDLDDDSDAEDENEDEDDEENEDEDEDEYGEDEDFEEDEELLDLEELAEEIETEVESEEPDMHMPVGVKGASDISEEDMYYGDTVPPPDAFGTAGADITSDLSLTEVEPEGEYEEQILVSDVLAAESISVKAKPGAELAKEETIVAAPGVPGKPTVEPVKDTTTPPGEEEEDEEGDDKPAERLLKKFEELKKKLDEGNHF